MRWLAVFLFALTFSTINAGEKDKKSPDEKAKIDNALLVVPPTGGKEVKLVDWRFTLGTRRLAIDGETVTKTAAGTEYLEFRDEKSTTYQIGILTLVPISSLKKITYDREKKAVAVETLAAGGKTETLVGTTKFQGINKLTLEAEALFDGLGSATVKFQGGLEKIGLQSIAFQSPKPAAEPNGAAFIVESEEGKEKTIIKHSVQDLQPLWIVNGTYKRLPDISFKKADKKTEDINFAKIASLKLVPAQKGKGQPYDFLVTLSDGTSQTLTMQTSVELDKKKSMPFAGLIGRTSVGYKLFPPHTIKALTRVDVKKE